MYAAQINSHDDYDEDDDDSCGDAIQIKQSPVSNPCIGQESKIFLW